MTDLVVQAPEAAEPTIALAAPGGPVLFEIAMKRFDAFWGGYQEHHRRATSIFGFSSFLAAGAVVVLDRMKTGGASLWLESGFAAVASLIYVLMAWNCYQAIRVRDFQGGIPVSPTRAAAAQLVLMTPDVAKTRLSVSIELSNEELRLASNARGGAVQHATVLCSLLAMLLFVGGVVASLPKRTSIVSSSESTPPPPSEPAPAAVPPVPSPPPVPDMTLLLSPIEQDVMLFKMSADRPPRNPPLAPAKK